MKKRPDLWQETCDEDMGAELMSAMARTDTILRGWVSYQEWAAYWPTATTDQDDANWINNTPTYVVSNALDTGEWGTLDTVSLLNGTLAEAINTLTRQPGKNIALQGSPTLVNALLQHDLLDELQLIVHDVVVYKGKRLFDTGSLKMQGWVQPLATTRQVIAVELQGHGHTADTDRPLSFATLGDDIAALLDQLTIPPAAAVVGQSFGGAVALQHPDTVRRLVVISSPFARSCWYPPAQEGMSQIGAAMAGNMMQTPPGQLSRPWPEPRRFARFLDKMGTLMSADYDWSADIATLPLPVLLVFADNDSISQQHIAAFFALLGGGVKEPGWQNTHLSRARLAVVPGYSHYNFLTSSEVPRIIRTFLADPLTDPPAGGAAASQVAPQT